MPAQTPILRARIVGGRVVWHGLDEKRWAALKLHLNNCEVEITIQKRRKRATQKQRQYYWPVIVTMIAKEIGYAPTEENLELVHEGLKWKFLRIVGGNGVLETVRSTESLTTAEKEEYHAHCRQFAAEEWGIYIPLPCEIVEDE